MTGISVGKAIYSILSGYTGLTYYVDDKIYPIFAPDETINPFVVYQRANNTITYSKDGLVYDEVSLTINVVSDNYTESINISEQVRAALELKNGIFSGVNIYQCLFSSVSEDFGVDGFVTTLQFTIKCR